MTRGERRATKGDKRGRPSTTMWRERKQRAEVIRRLTSFERFVCERKNLVVDSLIYLEPVERFKNRSNVMKFRSFGDSTRVRTSWRRFVCVAGKLSRRELILEWIREVAMVQAVVWSIVLRIRRRSRILRKHDLEIEEICCANDRFLSKMMPRLRAETTGESTEDDRVEYEEDLNIESCSSLPWNEWER